jgi:protein ImuB
VSAEVTRLLVVWCADWPVVAAGLGAEEPVAVLHANRVVACSAAARDEGVKRGLRKREAQARCPEVTVIDADDARDAIAFEPVAAAVESIAPRVEVVRPGVLAVAVRGPSRYFGGDMAAAERVAALAHEAIAGRAPVGAGVADGLAAALLAARRGDVTVVAPGASAAFLAPRPVDDLGRVIGEAWVLDLAALLRRLGLRTLGDVADVPSPLLAARFGPQGVLVGRLAQGLDQRPPRPRGIPPELVVSAECDPPADQAEAVAFLARTLATELDERLSGRGLACTRIGIEVETEHGETLARLWRHEGGLTPGQIADRVRWQLDGWLQAPPQHRPSGGISLLRLVPDQVGPDDGRQLGFWGGIREADERAARGVARLQGLLGADAVLVPERRGGRGPGEQLGLVPAHAVQLGQAQIASDADRPWPGRLPPPSPALVHESPVPLAMATEAGEPVRVTARGFLSGAPATLAVGSNAPVDVARSCGPWPADERWWVPGQHRRRARLQVVTASGAAHLLAWENAGWWLEATYD